MIYPISVPMTAYILFNKIKVKTYIIDIYIDNKYCKRTHLMIGCEYMTFLYAYPITGVKYNKLTFIYSLSFSLQFDTMDTNRYNIQNPNLLK